MSIRLHDRIRNILKTTPGLTQCGLAKHMGLNPANVNRMLHGRRNIMAEEIPVIEEYLGVKLSLSPSCDDAGYSQDCARQGKRGFSDLAQAQLYPDLRTATQPMVPVYCGVLPDRKIAGWAPRHSAQFGLRDAFAVYVDEDLMAPRYFRGELVYLHPHRPGEIQSDCLIDTYSGETMLRRLVLQTAEYVRVASFSPAQEKDIPRGDVRAIYSVVGRG